MRNKFIISCILTAISSQVFAMPYEPLSHDGIVELAFTGYGFKSDTDNTAYGINATSFTINNVNLASTGPVLKNDPEYQFGGTFFIGYYFPCSPLNINASYTGTRNNLEDSAQGRITPNLIPPIFLGGINSASAASSNYHFAYDYLNIELGSLTRVCHNQLIINPQLGLSYTRLDSNQVVRYTGGSLNTQSFVIENDSSFKGLGPSFGIDLAYLICQPFSIMGNFRYNALVGNIDSFYQLANSQNNFMNIPFKSKYTLVNLFQTELAIGYDFNVCNAFCGNFAIGYQVTKSISGAEQIQFVDDFSSSTFVDSLLNTNLHGYFARITMDFIPKSTKNRTVLAAAPIPVPTLVAEPLTEPLTEPCITPAEKSEVSDDCTLIWENTMLIRENAILKAELQQSQAQLADLKQKLLELVQTH
jgi:hypothetical protein